METARLILDTGVFILIWIVQLCIYPSFRYYSFKNFRKWHPVYTRQVTIIVMPLMVGQLGIAAFQLIAVQSFYTICSMCCIAGAWLITFFKAVPLHNAIFVSEADFDKNAIQLINYNWARTLLWSMVFGWTTVKNFTFN